VVGRVQETILDECWKPAFARYLIPKYTGLRLDLDRYLTYYNTDRAALLPQPATRHGATTALWSSAIAEGERADTWCG
jgi:hypothetical protein